MFKWAITNVRMTMARRNRMICSTQFSSVEYCEICAVNKLWPIWGTMRHTYNPYAKSAKTILIIFFAPFSLLHMTKRINKPKMCAQHTHTHTHHFNVDAANIILILNIRAQGMMRATYQTSLYKLTLIMFVGEFVVCCFTFTTTMHHISWKETFY